MNPTRYRIESQEAGSEMWKDTTPGQELSESEVETLLPMLRKAATEHAPGRQHRVIAIIERDITKEFE